MIPNPAFRYARASDAMTAINLIGRALPARPRHPCVTIHISCLLGFTTKIFTFRGRVYEANNRKLTLTAFPHECP